MTDTRSELDQPIISDEAMEELLNPDNMSGNQREALKRLDDKNVDHADLKEALAGALAAYEKAKNS